MKKTFSILSLSLVVLSMACSKSDSMPDPVTPVPPVENLKPDIRGIITTDQHWTKDKVYRLRGYVYVSTGATLTIDAGTKIVSSKDSAGVLVIYRGAKIQANGTAAEPIVFTSNETSPAPGDLGGVVLVGQAKGNGNHSVVEGGVDAAFSAFGGNDDADNSGTLKYVRIEYAGKAVNPGDEINGLSLYAVGSGTTIDYVQVVRGLDDAFEFFGGTVNCKHLIAYNSADDDYDLDDGYRGKIQFAISVKDPAFTDAKGTTGDVSNNFEVDNVNPANGFLLSRAPITSPVFSNFTAIGPNDAANTSADYGWGMRWRRGTKFILANSIVLGGKKGGLRLQEDSTISYYNKGISSFYNSYVHAITNPIDVVLNLPMKDGSTYDLASVTDLTTNTYKSVILTNPADMKLTDPFNNAAPNLQPAAGSPALTGALFDLSALNDAFFDKVAYKGAFDGTTDWTAGWAVWGK
ncbi:hypothetical protein [Flavihumibacter profundi]|uniref:hypothetical protein n=1 Tax=Flavihumibacter profundi TaxID=2716883 RepID=UPI001CC82744|nr:hypothetical protein [Flavihumibacter profundi]MBZ5857669.1 hypothetical protein [Flavihumibacter profundi]